LFLQELALFLEDLISQATQEEVFQGRLREQAQSVNEPLRDLILRLDSLRISKQREKRLRRKLDKSTPISNLSEVKERKEKDHEEEEL